MTGKGTVLLTFEDGTSKSWPDSYLLHEGDPRLDQHCRVVVHSGNFARASFRSDLVRSAVLEDE